MSFWLMNLPVSGVVVGNIIHQLPLSKMAALLLPGMMIALTMMAAPALIFMDGVLIRTVRLSAKSSGLILMFRAISIIPM